MGVTANSVWKNCLAFIKDNIQPQAFKTWFEPIKPIKLSDNALSIQVPSKFFYEWLEEHYVKLLKVALTKELGETAKLVYIIRMENTYGNKEPFTEKIPSTNRGNMGPQEMDVPIKSKNPELKNPLLNMENVIITPHAASGTSRMRPASRSRVGNEIVLALSGKWPMSIVNPSVMPKVPLERWQPYPMQRGPNR